MLAGLLWRCQLPDSSHRAPKQAAPKQAAPKPAPKVAPKKSTPPAKPALVAKAAAVKVLKPEKPALKKGPKVEVVFEDDAPVLPTPKTIVAEANGIALRAHPYADITGVQLKKLYLKLIEERHRLVEGMQGRLSDAISNVDPLADEIDIAQRHTEQASLMRFADKERKLLGEIDHAIEKMTTGEYGVCEGTEDAITFKRLEVRPHTRYSVAYKEQLERERKQHRR